MYPHDDIDIAAVPYEKNERCYMIEKRNGHGAPLQVFDVLPLFPSPTQISLSSMTNSAILVDEMNVSATRFFISGVPVK
ncbi:hypothetical protein [Psychrobacillus sp. MER TA 171]|uniref:hypothetical protein n=1 Tax=Psychrobacillus sp. MER TA 171 TaxID=2939577 RepID=UPI00203DF228|nr:hypothetical protein [Psychrobacillus sp. MER TA 171]MCM3358070.1 hypothetical protein [Psychrobacillus sp. MER TA 171]